MRVRLACALIATLVLWASAFAGIRAGLEGYSPYHLAFLRFFIASLALAAVAVARGIRLPSPADLPRILAVGFLGIAAYNTALNYGELTVSAGAASFVVAVVPMFTAAFSVLLLGERLRPAGWLGMFVSLAGVGLICLGESDELGLSSGVLIILLAAICQSLFFVLQKPLLGRYRPLEITCYSIWLGTLCLGVFVPGASQAVREASLTSTSAVVYLGVFPAALAFFSWAYVLARMPASRAAAFLFLVPGIAVVVAYLWLNETPAWTSLVGGTLALAGVATTTAGERDSRRRWRRRKLRAQPGAAEVPTCDSA
jgi:drug/metabolite transporter (DMT)-like permease